jgi:phage shock protein A
MTAADKLVEAKDALHNLLTGKRSVMLQYGDTRTQFTAGNIDELRRYIAQLEAEIDSTKARRPLSVRW